MRGGRGMRGRGGRGLAVELSLLLLNQALEGAQVGLSAVQVAIGDGLDSLRHLASLIHPALEHRLQRGQGWAVLVDLR